MIHHRTPFFLVAENVLSAFPPTAVLIAAAAIGCGGAATPETGSQSVGLPRTSSEITAADLSAHTRELSDDRMLGRGPGQKGEAVTLEYLQAAFERIGLKPMGDISPTGAQPESRRFLQKVDLVGITADGETARLSIQGPADGRVLDLEHGRDFMARTTVPEEVIDISGDVVFVGYGIDAPEEDWNDFGDVDVSGKILLVLPGEPPVEDPDRFGGEAMTYYGRWTFKIEEAGRRGAAGVLLIHDADTSGYTWDVIKGRSGERLQTTGRSTPPSGAPFQGWIAEDAATKIFRTAGLDRERLTTSAASEDFAPVDLGLTASGHLQNTIRTVTSANVVGAVEGSDPLRAGEFILFVAHWDHLGVGDEVDGDGIFNGAIDNAIGTAALLEVAEAWASMDPVPRRSALFLASTAEESGFLGVVSYVENPVVPLAKTLAAINIDGVNVFGPTEDVWIVGEGLNTLEGDLEAVLEAGGRYLSPDPAPEEGNFFRSDHFPFALAGVPALCVRPGTDFIDKPGGFGREVWTDYYSNRYHRPSDEFDERWDFDSTAQDVEIMLEVARRVSAAEAWPRWHPGNQYKATREATLQRTTAH